MEVYFPIAFYFGIGYSDFMNMTPKVFSYFRKEYKRKRQEEVEMIDYTAWRNGIYICDAISACFGKNHKYPKQCYSLSHKQRQEEQGLTDAERFATFAISFNQSRKRGEVSGK